MKKQIRNLFGPKIMKHVDQVRHELRYRPAAMWSNWKTSRTTAAKRSALRKSFAELKANPPDVLIGANIGGSNGIAHHISAIRNFSRLRVELSPPDWLLKELTPHDVSTVFRDEVMEFAPSGTKVLHSHVFPYYIQWCRRHRDAVGLWVHTYHLQYYPLDGAPLEPWQLEFNRALVEEARFADVKISVSKWQAKELWDLHGIQSIHIPNGVNVGHCDLGSAERFRARFGNDRFVLYVGRLEAVKNPAEFVRLAQRMPDQRFMMMGGGLSADELRSHWRVECPSNLVLAGSATHIEVQDALAACAVVVVTSLREGLPTLVLEAMAHRKPVVVSNEQGSAEAVDGGKFGRVYSLGDLDDLEANVRAALSGPTEIPEARQHILEVYDWRVIAPQLDSIYSGHR